MLFFRLFLSGLNNTSISLPSFYIFLSNFFIFITVVLSELSPNFSRLSPKLWCPLLNNHGLTQLLDLLWRGKTAFKPAESSFNYAGIDNLPWVEICKEGLLPPHLDMQPQSSFHLINIYCWNQRHKYLQVPVSVLKDIMVHFREKPYDRSRFT